MGKSASLLLSPWLRGKLPFPSYPLYQSRPQGSSTFRGAGHQQYRKIPTSGRGLPLPFHHLNPYKGIFIIKNPPWHLGKTKLLFKRQQP